MINRLMVRIHNLVAPLFAWLPRPLDPVRSIKAKLSLALGFAGGVGLLVFWGSIGWMRVEWSWLAVALVLALVTLQVMAHGATTPLREMTAAARAMARGDYTRKHGILRELSATLTCAPAEVGASVTRLQESLQETRRALAEYQERALDAGRRLCRPCKSHEGGNPFSS